jgi:hypothetical protein
LNLGAAELFAEAYDFYSEVTSLEPDLFLFLISANLPAIS